MKTQTLVQSFGFFLVAVAASLVILALVHALQTPGPLASVGWNFPL
jgi:hypothetical protein